MIILDGINNFPSQYRDLFWLPLELPPKVHIILSSSHDPKIMEIANMRSGGAISTLNQVHKSVEGKWIHIPIQSLTPQERQVILQSQIPRGHNVEETMVLCIFIFILITKLVVA